MPIDLSEAETGGIDLYFADSLEGTVFSLRESAVYEAEEVREETQSDVPKFGDWLPVDTEAGDAWAVAVGELVRELQQFEKPTTNTYEVTRCEKSGQEQTDPYEVNIEVVEDGNQAKLG